MALSPILQNVVDNWHNYDAGTQLKLIQLIREFRKKYEGQSCGVMPASAVEAMADAVPTQLMADIVKDLRSGPSTPASLADDGKPRGAVVRGSGWQTPRPDDRSAAQTRIYDDMVNHMVGGPNEPVK